MTENTFVIRIWCEHSEQESVKPQFRGVIEHVISGQRQYLIDTQGISTFIQDQITLNSENLTSTSSSLTNWINQESS